MTDFHLTLKRPLVFLPAIAVSMAVAVLCAYFVMPAPQAVAAVATPAGTLLVAKAALVRDRSCETCGFMQTIKRSDPATGEPIYEFSVRMRDGSTRASTGVTRGRWLEGERVILIGGAAARAIEEEKNTAL